MFIAHHIPASSQRFFLAPERIHFWGVEQINELTYLILDLSKETHPLEYIIIIIIIIVIIILLLLLLLILLLLLLLLLLLFIYLLITH